MPVTRSEKVWINAYRKSLKKLGPKKIRTMLLFGSKARGDDNADSDLDILLIVPNRAAGLKRKLRRIGYLLAAGTEVMPSIMVYTEEEWEDRNVSGSPFHRAVERDQVRLL